MKAKLKKLIPKNRFVRSVSVLAGGTAAGQLIVIGASPILTRLYTPEDFGLLAVYGGILGILGTIASLRYHLAIPLPGSDNEAASIAVLSLITVVVTTLCTSVVVIFLRDQISSLLNTPALATYFWLVPIGFFLIGIYQVFQYWAIRTKDYSNIARTRLSQSIGMVLTQIFGYTLGPIALLLGRVVGSGAGVLSLVKSAYKRNGNEFKPKNIKKIRNVAIEYRHFPVLSTWTGLASSCGSNLPPILIASLLGAGPAGMYALAHRVLSQPMVVVGRAVGDVFYRQAAEAQRNGTLEQAVLGVYTGLTRITLPPAVFAFFIIPDVFSMIFGNSWGEAGQVSRWMIPWLFLELTINPSTRVYPILGLHAVALRFQLSLLFSTVFSTLIGGIYFESLVSTVVLMMVFNSLIYLWRVTYTFKLVGVRRVEIIYILAKASLASIVCSLPLFGLLIFYESVFDAGYISFVMISISLFNLLFYGILTVKKVR